MTTDIPSDTNRKLGLWTRQRGALARLRPGRARHEEKALVARGATDPVARPRRSYDEVVEAESKSGGGSLLRSFAIFVVLPTILAFFYLALIETPQFTSESRFVIRAATEPKGMISDAASLISKLGVTGGTKSTTQDGFIASEYIRGRTIILDIGGRPYLEQHFSNPEIDWLSRLEREASIEDLWKYWNRHVSVTLDTISGVVTLRVNGFKARDALEINQNIVQLTESLINKVSERTRSDALTRARAEVDASVAKLLASKQKLLEFRNKNVLIDPVSKASSIGEIIAQLTVKRIELEVQISSLASSLAANSPSQKLLVEQMKVIDQQIKEQQSLLAGSAVNPKVSNEISEYEQLKLNEVFDQKLYEISQASYQKARQEAEKQQLFLALVVPPVLPEKALLPKIGVDTFLVFAFCLIMWGIVSLLIASVREHMV